MLLNTQGFEQNNYIRQGHLTDFLHVPNERRAPRYSLNDTIKKKTRQALQWFRNTIGHASNNSIQLPNSKITIHSMLTPQIQFCIFLEGSNNIHHHTTPNCVHHQQWQIQEFRVEGAWKWSTVRSHKLKNLSPRKESVSSTLSQNLLEMSTKFNYSP